MAYTEHCAIKVEQRRLALPLDDRLGIHRPLGIGSLPGLQSQPGEIQLLVGAGIKLLGHAGTPD
jgi:hypothetical protein